MNNHVNLSVDVGGTWTRLSIVGSGLKRVPSKKVRSQAHQLKSQIRHFIKSHQLKTKQITVGIRGVWTPKEKRIWKNQLRGLAPQVKVFSDIELLYWQAFGTGPGIVLNAGTGSMALGRSGSGRMIRAGGLGPLIGDDGSAFWMGKRYLQEKMNPADQRKYATRPDAVAKIAGLSKKVIQAAQRGNITCQKIVSESQQHLNELVKQVKKGIRNQNVEIFLAGGLFKNKYFRQSYLKNVCRGEAVPRPGA